MAVRLANSLKMMSNGDDDGSPVGSLVKTCIKFIVKNKVSIRNVLLPQEICDQLIEYHRSINSNSSHHQLEYEHSSFYRQFKANNSRVTKANFSDLSVDSETLESFLDEHSKTIQCLDISNCPNLFPKTLNAINNILTKVTDVKKMHRTLKIYEIINGSKRLIVDKHYHNGILTTRTGQNGVLKEEIGIFHDDYVLTERMGGFSDRDLNGFNGFQSKKLREMSGFDYSPYPLIETEYLPYIMEPCAPKRNYPISNPLFFFDFETFKPYECFQVEDEEKKMIKRIEIKSWQECPLHTLIIGKSTNILPESLELKENDDDDDDDDDEINYIINPLLGLKKLVIHELNLYEGNSYLKHLITPLMRTTLQHLDLSNCSTIFDGESLVQLENLRILILYNCPKLHLALHNIIKLKKLRYLDISTSDERYGHCYKEPIAQLALIVDNLPFLTHLDISGTNLAGPRCQQSHIPGLNSRQTRFFEYLGLYNTANEAAYRKKIPAHIIAGDAVEQQIVTACEVYVDRLDFLRRALNDLFHCYRFESNYHDVNRSCQVILNCMTKHLQDKQIQIAASASLFYIVKSDEAKQIFTTKIKRQIVSCLLDAMITHRHDPTMLRNGSLTLIHFKIPNDVIFEYTRLAEILLQIVTTHDEDDFIQRLGIFLLNSLACQVDGDQRTTFGDLGAIQKMLLLIDYRLRRNICDEVLEMAWSTMWNVTDETPINCERFLENNGMDYFISCMSSFPDRPELLRNIMGLLGNVAECAHLRHRLMRPEYIQRFTDLLDSTSDGIEVSYNAAGILSHIAYDGPDFWYRYLPCDCKREETLKRMRQAISRWKINSKRNINYRSFEPILRLLKSDQPSSEAQYWAVWALANLTRVYSNKYCPLLEEDHGIEVLENLIKNDLVAVNVKKLARLTLYQYKKFQEFGNLDGLENSEEIDIIEDDDETGDMNDNDNDVTDEFSEDDNISINYVQNSKKYFHEEEESME